MFLFGSQRGRIGWSWAITCALGVASTFIKGALAGDVEKTAADYYVYSLPGQPEGPLLRMHAGHVEVSPEHKGNLFFWHYENRHIADRRRTVIWLNGGPGCSSEDGGLMEIGPYRVEEGGKLRYNNGSWDQFASLLFVDNPVGTGFSYVNGDSYLHELQEMADHFIIFLDKWFSMFPDYLEDDLYIAGESYAGQHIPYIATTILERNKKVAVTKEKQWNLQGLLIGNGWISPVHQYQAYSDYAYEEGMIQGGTESAARVDKSLADCLEVIGKPGGSDIVTVGACEGVLSTILDVTRTPDGQCPNMYDIRLTDSFPSCGMNWPPDLETVTPYLRREDVKEALHINKEKREGWSECSGSVSGNFRTPKSKPSYQLLPGLLETGLPITLFSGDRDMICNHLGTEYLIADMTWNGEKGFKLSTGDLAPIKDWEFEGEPAGTYQEARNLTYVLLYNSSHMVPFDYPRRSLDMLNRFMGVDTTAVGKMPSDMFLEVDNPSSNPTGTASPPPLTTPTTNATLLAEQEKDRLHKAELKAYYRSGEAALVVVIIASAIFAAFVWRQRRSNRRGWAKNDVALGSYMSLPGTTANGNNNGGGTNGHTRGKRPAGGNRDVKAGDFDEAELDKLYRDGRAVSGGGGGQAEVYDLASDSEDEEGARGK